MCSTGESVNFTTPAHIRLFDHVSDKSLQSKKTRHMFIFKSTG